MRTRMNETYHRDLQGSLLPPKARPRDSKRLRARHHSLLLPVAKAMAHHGGAGAFSTSGVQTPQICRKVWELRPVWLLPVSFQTGNEHSCMIMHKWSCINDHKCTMVPGLMQWAWVWKKQLLHSTCFDHIRYGHHMTPYFLLYIHILQSKLHERKQPAMLPTNHYVHPWRGHMSGLVWQLDVTSTLSVHSLFFSCFYCITCEQVILSSYCFLFGLETPNSAKRSLGFTISTIAIYREIGGRKIAQSAASIR